MSTVILKGSEAVHYAEEHHLKLHEYPHDQQGPRDDVPIQEAQDIAREHPKHIWLETHVAVKSGEV